MSSYFLWLFIFYVTASAEASSSLRAKIDLALEDLKQFPPFASNPRFETDFMKSSPYEFFSARAKVIELDMDPKSSACQPGVVAYVRNSASQTLYVCPYAENLTVLALQSNLLHEARHLDGPEYTGVFSPEHPDAETAYPHVLCIRGVFEDYEACDERYEDGGSYSIQTEFFLKVASANGVGEELRQEARGMAVTYLLDHFNQLPLGITQGVLLLSADRTLSFYDGPENPLTEILRNIPIDSIVALRSLPTILNKSNFSVRSYLSSEAFMETPGAFSKKFRESLTPIEREKLIDVYYGGLQACFLFTDSIYCEVGGRHKTLQLPEGVVPIHLNILNLFGGDMVHVVGEDGSFYYIPFHKPIEEWTSDMMEKNMTLDGYRSVAMMPGFFNVAITLDGRLLQFEKLAEPQPVELLKSQRFEKCLSPVLWSSRFEDI